MHATKCLDEAGVVGGVERVVGFGDARVPRKAQVFHEDGEATIDMTEDITVDGSEGEPQLEAPSTAEDGEDIEMPDFSEFLKGVMDDADDMLKEATGDEKPSEETKPEEQKKPTKGEDEPSDFNVNDLM